MNASNNAETSLQAIQCFCLTVPGHSEYQVNSVELGGFRKMLSRDVEHHEIDVLCASNTMLQHASLLSKVNLSVNHLTTTPVIL